jgi:hypothetical protein
MSPAGPTNGRELGQLKIWKDLLDLHAEILSPDTLETVERRPSFPAFECRRGRAVSRSREGERLDFSGPSGIEEEGDGKTLGHGQRWQNAVKWRDIEPRSQTIEDVANYEGCG